MLVGAEQPLDFLHPVIFFLSLFNEGLILLYAPRRAAPSSVLVPVETTGSLAKDVSLRPSQFFRLPVPEMKDGSLSVMLCLGRKGFGTRDS